LTAGGSLKNFSYERNIYAQPHHVGDWNPNPLYNFVYPIFLTVKGVDMPLPSVLLVEDYPASVLVGTLMLEHLGYVVETATSGQEAVEKVRAASRPFLAILMDVQMPGMDGFAAMQLIRKLELEKGYRNTIIAVTAQALAGDRERCLAAGMDDYISKPIRPDILAQKLTAIITAMLRGA
jgi:CheY-like chemotaxis protein